MHINNQISPYTAHTPANQPNVQNDSSASANAGDTFTLSKDGQNIEQKWQTFAEQYDVTNINQQQINQLTQGLFDAGLLSTTEMMIMGAPLSMNTEQTGSVDLLSDMKHTLDLSTPTLNAEQKHNYQSVIDILQNLADKRMR
ncbi:hypothetical protein HR060_09145 [Catenovulum sp. SM1970]|uniref:hypothetical protein n=1 Tax=Marinifaba aquimaris TaxID=2741323 RepID=UPI001572B341|nr:hypothetical protein [Marinifaba aquimaris]NTS77037.1 hypothetical protein [Marinifaba aquimaris]